MTAPAATELREIAAEGARRFGDDTDPLEVIRWVYDTFPADQLLVASNMQDAALVHLATQATAADDVRVLFLDTGYHFPETIGTRDAVEAIYRVSVVNAVPEQTVAEQDAAWGKDLFARDPNQCCNLRKVVPLRKYLAGQSAWITGIRRVEAPTRAHAPLISFDEGFGLVKINPIVTWTDEQMADFITAEQLLVNPLVEEGYPSIGCAPCTNKPAPGEDARSGRWTGLSKTECGLHAS